MQEVPSKNPQIPDPNAARKQRHKFFVFSITAAIYASLHASRTAWAYTKPSLAYDLRLNDTALSVLDTSFLTIYAIGLYLSGWLGDRIKLVLLLGKGIFLSVAALSLFVLFFGFMRISSLLIGASMFILSGLGQSSGFPGCIAILNNWFPGGEKGLMFGFWLVNINVGNILGQQIGRITLDVLHLEWYYPIIVSTALMFLLTLIMMELLFVHPKELDIPVKPRRFLPKLWGPKTNDNTSKGTLLQEISVQNPKETSVETSIEEVKQRGIGFVEALKVPGVLLYSIVFICVKSALYGLLFWLPMYLKTEVGFKNETAGLLACQEIGQLAGVLLLGFISDKLKNRSGILTFGLSCAVITFFGINYLRSTEQIWAFRILLFIAGMCIGGPAGMIGSTISAELGDENEKESKNKEVKSTSTITGIIDGSGTAGAAITQLIIPYFKSWCFLYYTVICLIAVILIPFAHKQILNAKTIRRRSVELAKALEMPKTGASNMDAMEI